jgi:pyruvate formate lyase activating enzyme
MKQARWFDRLDGGSVRCRTCAHQCLIAPGKRGICGVMENREGVLFSLVYGRAAAVHVDPIEKKPLFHFLPASTSLSMSTVGCNMHCFNCQNADISQMPREQGRISGESVSPEALVDSALRSKCASISYTYTEPSVYWDYAFDIASLARERGIKNVFVTNGYFSKESLDAIAPLMDAANVDLKSFRDGTYARVCGARLQPVLDTITEMRKRGVWIEITTLLIPGLNDSDGELKDSASFIFALDPDLPWHISRFHPTYRMQDRPPTPAGSVKKARSIGLDAGLRFVYAGNMPGDESENTFCWKCGRLLVERFGFQVSRNDLPADGRCPQCGTKIAGIWK